MGQRKAHSLSAPCFSMWSGLYQVLKDSNLTSCEHRDNRFHHVHIKNLKSPRRKAVDGNLNPGPDPAACRTSFRVSAWLRFWTFTGPLEYLDSLLFIFLEPFCCRLAAVHEIIVLLHLDPVWSQLQLSDRWTHIWLRTLWSTEVVQWSTRWLQGVQTISPPPPCWLLVWCLVVRICCIVFALEVNILHWSHVSKGHWSRRLRFGKIWKNHKSHAAM